MKEIIATAVIKGGTGKTTTCAALAQAGAKAGKKVLAIDLDPQANLSFALGADPNAPGSYQLLHDTPAQELLQQTPQQITVIPASPDLATEQSTTSSAKRLQRALKPILNDFDLIVIDTPPTLGELQFNALQAATGLLIPLEADTFSLQGLYQITDIAKHMARSNPNLRILGVVLTRYNGRPKINRYLREAIAERGAEIGAPTIAVIRAGIAASEAAATQQSLFDYAPNSNPAQDYQELYNFIMEGE